MVHPTSIEQIKELFVDPENPAANEDLAELARYTIQVLNQVYAGEKPELEIARQDQQTTLAVLNDILARETDTRKFDELFFGQIHPFGNRVAILANIVAAYMNTNTIVKEVSMAEHAMESEVLTRMGSWFGYTESWDRWVRDNNCDLLRPPGNITSGGTTANIQALWAAREKIIHEQGLTRDVPLYVLSNEKSHYSLDKACNILGLTPIKIPVTDLRTDISELERALRFPERYLGDGRRDGQVAAIFGVAGATETGAVDDLSAMADLAEEFGIFFHVDAAYGGPFILVEERAHLFDGVERSDSITIDPHKMMYSPYAAGAVLFRDPETIAIISKDMVQNARYLPKAKENYGLTRVEGSMGSGGVISTWATLQLMGEQGLEVLLRHTLELTAYAYERTSRSSLLKPLHQPDTNTLLIGVNDLGLSTEQHNKVIKTTRNRVDELGPYISMNENVDGKKGDKSGFRFVAMNPHSTPEDVETLISSIEEELVAQLDPSIKQLVS